MDITALKEQIMKKKLKNFYVFTGTEIGIQKIYLDQMSKVYKMPITRAESVAKIYSKCTKKSLFGDTSGFYVIRDDNEISKNEDIYQKLPRVIKGNVIVLLYEKIDSRLKFGKYFKDCIVEFNKLATNVLNSYIKKACPMSSDRIAELSNEVSGSYDMAMLEVDKINQYTQHKKIDVNMSFDELLESGVIFQPQEQTVFEFTDAVCARDEKRAIMIAQTLQENNVSAINILGTLYNSLKTVMLIQVCEGSDICNITGLDNRQVYFNKKYAHYKYSTAELVNAVKLVSKVVSGIKNGWIEDKYATSYIICKIM